MIQRQVFKLTKTNRPHHYFRNTDFFMKAFFAILFFSWIISLYMPWWGVFIPALIFGAWLLNRSSSAFFTGFLAVGLVWFFQALYIHVANDGILSTRIAEMMGLGSAWMVLMITFLIGGIPGGLGALMGYLFKAGFRATSVTPQAS